MELTLRIITLISATLLLCNTNVQCQQYQCPFSMLDQVNYDTIIPASSANVPVLVSTASYAGVDTKSSNAYVEPVKATKPVPAPGFSGKSIDAWLKNYFKSDIPTPIYKGNSIAKTSTRAASNRRRSDEISWLNYYASTPKQQRLKCAVPPSTCAANRKNYFYRSYDGSCNNLKYPVYGMSNSRHTRLIAPRYGDGVYAPTLSVRGGPLPNPRQVSLSLYGEKTKADNFRTLVFMQYGQIVAHDLSKFTTQGAPKDCCKSIRDKLCYPIPLHPNGPIAKGSKKQCLHFARGLSDKDISCPASTNGYAEKITVATAYLDLSFLYGNSAEENNKTRLFQGGLLKTSFLNKKHLIPIQTNQAGECGNEENFQCFSLPDGRNQFTPTVTVLHTLLLREHNRLSKALKSLNPHFNDERLFQEARKINIAQFQKISYYDYLPLLLGPNFARANGLVYPGAIASSSYVDDYNSELNAAPYADFSSAAFRYSHVQIPGWFSMVPAKAGKEQLLRLSDHFERPENINLLANGDNFDSLIRGMVTQLQKQPDENIDKEIKHNFDRKAFDTVGGDLKAFDIQRARDFGLPSYNDYREICGLARAYNWKGFEREISADNIAVLQKLYATPDDVDLSVGGSLEKHLPEAIVGPTFQYIIGKQFYKTRAGDRFFFERGDLRTGFNREQLAEIRKSSLSALFCNNADHLEKIQWNAFAYPSKSNAFVSCYQIPKINLNKWKDIKKRNY